MKQRKWFQPILIFLLSALLLNACSFSVEVLATPTIPPPTATPPLPTSTPVPFTLVPASATPTLISIRDGTVYMLEVFMSLDGGEYPRSLVFSPDGTVLATAGGNHEDFVIRLWDVATGQSLGTLEEHKGIVWELALSPDSQMLASVSSDKTAKIWDWRSGTVLKSLDFPAEVASVKFSPDGQILAVGGVDEPVADIRHASVWTFSTGSWNPRFKIPEYWNIVTMTYSPDGRWLVGGGTSRNVQVWRTSDGTSVFTLNHSHQVGEAAISPDSSTVATSTCKTVTNAECTEGGIWLWDLPSGRLIKKITGFPNLVESVAFAVDGSLLLAASRDGTLRVYNTADYQPIFESTPPGGNGFMALSPDGGLLATAGNDGTVHVWKVVSRP